MGLLPTTLTLEGTLVRLEPLSGRHEADLGDAAEEDRRTYDFTWVPRRSEIGEYLDSQSRRAESGKLLPFAQIRLRDERPVGCTAFWDPRLAWPLRSMRRGDRVHVARGVCPGHRDQPRSQAAPPRMCLRKPGVAPGRSEDRCIGTNDLGGRSRASELSSREFFGAGRSPGPPERKANSVTRPCTR